MDTQKNIVNFSLFSALPYVVHGISTRKLGSVKDKGTVLQKSLFSVARELHTDEKNIFFLKQVHGAVVLHATRNTLQTFRDGDGFITEEKGIVIGMTTADCLPIIFADQTRKIVGVIHAGYKGILAGIIENMIAEMTKKGSNPKNILVGIGPGIGVCCYDVLLPRLALFEEKYGKDKEFYQKKESKIYLDLKKIAAMVLLNQGISAEHIQTLPFCTSCDNDQFFSYRKDSDLTYGEFATVIGIK